MSQESRPRLHGEELRGIDLPRKDRNAEGRFGVMFKNLSAFEPPDALLQALERTMHEPGPPAPPELTNRTIPSGFTFLGQFIDHDITLDTTPLEEARADPDAVRNFRSARYDLDSVYGRGPEADPDLYEAGDRDKLRLTGLGDPTVPDDLPRHPDGTAKIGDPRNEENLIIAQLQIAFINFHNAVVDYVRSQPSPPQSVFEEARRLTMWHYQWAVVHDFLPRIIGTEILGDILEERPNQPAKVKLRFYKPRNPNRPMMPIEFAVAAYRFGHSQIRGGYRVNSTVGAAFFGNAASDSNLNGFRPIPPSLLVEWRRFFEIPGAAGEPDNLTRKIDTRLSESLFNLPAPIVPPPDIRRSLALRNLLRGKVKGLPSGQAVANEMGLAPLSNQQLGIPDDPGWNSQAPLWYYVLKEAELQQNGDRLGQVGGRIVGEVLVGLLEKDSRSYLRRDPRFRPQPPFASTPGGFTIGDLLRFAKAA